jgi:hypothetical protein
MIPQKGCQPEILWRNGGKQTFDEPQINGSMSGFQDLRCGREKILSIVWNDPRDNITGRNHSICTSHPYSNPLPCGMKLELQFALFDLLYLSQGKVRPMETLCIGNDLAIYSRGSENKIERGQAIMDRNFVDQIFKEKGEAIRLLRWERGRTDKVKKPLLLPANPLLLQELNRLHNDPFPSLLNLFRGHLPSPFR